MNFIDNNLKINYHRMRNNMKLLKQLFILLILSSIFTVFSEPEEIVLQNGLDQYNDCIDADYRNTNKNTNYANSTTLEVRCDGC